MIGSHIIRRLKDSFTFIPLGSADLDITQKSAVDAKLTGIDYDLLLHLAAYTHVDGAETEKESAYRMNVMGTKYLYQKVIAQGKKMIYVSTDFVFNGKNPPFDETSLPDPIGYYGRTKYEGERLVQNGAMIVRISYPYGTDQGKKPDFVQRLRDAMGSGKTLTMITDAAMTPTHVDDITGGLSYLFNNFKPEIYHLVGSRAYAPYVVGTLIAKRFGFPASRILPATFAEYAAGKSPRPQHSVITSRRNTFQPMRSFEDGLVSVQE